jgi:phosphatidylglycerophosphate synthase
VSANPRDGHLDALVFRRLARPVTRRLLGTAVTPNAVTIAGVAIGVTGGLSLAWPGGIAVALAVTLLACSNVLDCVDGELARLRGAESRLGHVLDVTGDLLVNAALLAGIALALGRTGAAPGQRTVALLGLGIAGAFAAITWSEATEARRRRVAGWENRLLDGVLGPLTTRDWHVFPVLFALAGRLDALLPAAALGAQGFWVLVVVLVTRALRRSST